jgi:tetratricopeptide (TPR) repeat protein
MSGSSKKKTIAVLSSLPTSPAGEMPGVADSHPLKSENPAAGMNDRWLVAGVCIFLAAITFAVFGQTVRHEFVNYDDNFNVYDNSAVNRGLNLKGVEWAFKFSQWDYWHPLDFLSHMLDCQWYGLHAGGHHLTNILLHTATVILLFLVLRRMMSLRSDNSVGATATQAGALWRSAFVAAVFAVHPLRVESVAWVSERKDVLSGLFFMLTLWAYVRYVEKSKVQSPKTKVFYGLVLLFFALGLMSKPMVVTLPFVLLLLDYWPLKRFVPLATPGDVSETKSAGWRSYRPVVIRMMVEKLPLFMLSAASCMQTANIGSSTIGSSTVFEGNKSLPIILRISNAMVSYVAYIWQMVCPVKLAVLYPYPVEGVPLGEVIGAVILLVFISTVLFILRQRHPCFLVGWLWYLGMLVPMIGFVQAGPQARADRHTYLPQIGLYLLLTWAAAELCTGWRHRRLVLGGLATVILAALIFCARVQTSYWRNSESLWTHTLACTSDNFIGHMNLGDALFKMGKVDEAIAQCQMALQINPDQARAHINLADALFKIGKVDEAIAQYQQALQIKPDYAAAHINLGNALLQKGQVDEAIVHYQQALQIKPDYAEAGYNLGNALFQKGNVDEAIASYQQALNIKPDYAEAGYNLGTALLKKGNVDEAIAQYQQALKIKPDYVEAHINLGTTLLQKGKVDEAIVQYQQALQIKPNYADAHYNLGNALIQKGKIEEAIVHFQKALQLNPDDAEACYKLGNILLQKGRVDEAITHLQKTLQIKPDSPDVLNNLAWLLATSPDAHIRDGVQAVKYAERACELTNYKQTIMVGTLAAAFAEAGRFDDAIATAQKACALASESGDQDLLKKNQELLAMYLKHQPYHEATEKLVPAAP